MLRLCTSTAFAFVLFLAARASSQEAPRQEVPVQRVARDATFAPLVQTVNTDSNERAAGNATNTTATISAASDAAMAKDLARAREWMVNERVVHERLKTRAAQALQDAYDKLSPADVRVLLMVYEREYRVAYPYVRPASSGDAVQDLREWVVAQRIVRDNLNVAQARDYALEVADMSPTQLAELKHAYERLADKEKAKQTAKTDPQDLSADELTARQQVENIQRQAALDGAANLRQQTAVIQQEAVQGAAGAARDASDRVRAEQQYTRQIYNQRLQDNWWYYNYNFWRP